MVLDDVVDLFGAGQAGGSVAALAGGTVVAGTDLALTLDVFSSITSEIVATGGSRFDCDVDGTVAVPLYLGPANGFAPDAPLPTPRAGATLTTLPDGRVLLFGDGGAALFNPVDRAWCTDCIIGGDARTEHTATALADGRVLIAGGVVDDAFASEVLLFDGTSFSSIGALERRGAGAARVDDDVVLIVGGIDETGAPSASAFLVNVRTNSMRTAVGTLAVARAFPATASLPNGGALVAGGEDDAGDPLDSLELYRSDETFVGPSFACPSAPTGENLCAKRSRASAVVLDDGNVLIIGGVAVSLDASPPPDGDVFVVSDQRALVSTPTSTSTSRLGSAAARITCGAPPCPILIAGGLDAPHALFRIAASPPALGASDYGGALVEATRDVVQAARSDVAMAALGDGTMLLVGGNDAAAAAQSTTARFTLCEASEGLACPEL